MSLASASAAADASDSVIDLGGGHVVEFLEFERGVIATVESGPEGTHPIVTGELAEKTPLEIWDALEPSGLPAPASLVEASIVVPEAEQEPAEQPPSEPSGIEQGKGPVFYGQGEHDWFKERFCLASPSHSHCAFGWERLSSTSPKGGKYETIAMNHGESPTPGRLHVQVRRCRESCNAINRDCETHCKWETLNDRPVNPNSWVSYAQNNVSFQHKFGGAQYSSTIEGAFGSHVSLSATWYPVQKPSTPEPPRAAARQVTWQCQCNSAPTVLISTPITQCVLDDVGVADIHLRTHCSNFCWPAPGGAINARIGNPC